MGKSLDKAFLLVQLVAAGRTTLTEIAHESNLPRSTTYRFLSELVRQGILARDRRSYRLGIRLIELGEKAKRGLRISQVALEPMQDLARRTKETVHLGVLEELDIMYLEKVNGDRGLQMASYIGLRTPAQCTAMGKVLIAAQPETMWLQYFQEIPPRTANTISSLEEFLAEIAHVKASGYALDLEENEVGIRCVAAPIRNSIGSIPIAVSISGASVYISEQRQKELVPEVVDCARTISRDMGAP